MQVKYLGTRLNKRQARGAVTGKRYSYSSGQPIFRIEEADRLQFVGDVEDGKPKFTFDLTPAPVVVEATQEPVEDGVPAPTPITFQDILQLSIEELRPHLRGDTELGHSDYVRMLAMEEAGQNRAGAVNIFKAWIDATS
jgi:hypothetical protein